MREGQGHHTGYRRTPGRARSTLDEGAAADGCEGEGQPQQRGSQRQVGYQITAVRGSLPVSHLWTPIPEGVTCR